MTGTGAAGAVAVAREGLGDETPNSIPLRLLRPILPAPARSSPRSARATDTTVRGALHASRADPLEARVAGIVAEGEEERRSWPRAARRS